VVDFLVEVAFSHPLLPWVEGAVLAVEALAEVAVALEALVAEVLVAVAQVVTGNTHTLSIVHPKTGFQFIKLTAYIFCKLTKTHVQAAPCAYIVE
jgi:hypothetical protein